MTSPTPQNVQIPTDVMVKLRDLGKKSLYFFTKVILGYEDLVKRIHKPICELLQNHTNKCLRIVIPRGWFKTTVCSIAFPLHAAINNPNVRVLIAQNTQTNAIAKLRAIRDQVERNELFRVLYPEVLPDRDCVWSAHALQLKRPGSFPEATFEAIGTGGKVTSRHYDVIVEDDTVSPGLDEQGEENVVPSEMDVSQAIGWHRDVVSLLDHPTRSRNVVVGTRWFEKDLLSWIKFNEKWFVSYERAALEMEDGTPSDDGDPTFPERFDHEVLEKLRASRGPYMFACLYMNNPMRSGDMVFRREWFRFYDSEPANLVTYTTVDLAGDPRFSNGSDFNAVVTCGKDVITGNVYVLECWRKRTNMGEVIDEIMGHWRRWKFVKLGVESVAYQSSMLHWLNERKRKEKVGFVMEPITHGKRSKESRIRGLQPLASNGKLYFRPSHQQLIAELESFPFGANDDFADALAMQLPMWSYTRSVPEVEREDMILDPLSFDYAEQELRQRARFSGGKVWLGDVLSRREPVLADRILR